MQVKNSPYRVLYPRFSETCIVRRGAELEDHLKVGSETVAYIEHCAAEAGKVTASATFSTATRGRLPFLDASVLCLIIDAYKNRLAEAKCSLSLGLGRIKWKGRNLLISRDGKVRVRLALSKEDVLRILKSASRLVWAGIICSDCGEPAIQCASGSCSRCLQSESSILDRSMTTSLGGKVVNGVHSTSFEIEKLFNGPLLVKGYESVEKAAAKMSERWDTLVNFFKDLQSSPPKQLEATEIERILHRIMLIALIYITEAPNKQDCMPGLLLLGLTSDLKFTHNLFENVSGTLLENAALWSCVGRGTIAKIQEVMTDAWAVHLNALAAFMHGDIGLALKAKECYKRFCEKVTSLKDAVSKAEGLEDTKVIYNLLHDIELVAVKGSHILRLIPMWT